MAALGKTIRILFLDGQERTFPNALVDQETAGWLYITRLEVEEGRSAARRKLLLATAWKP
jgi:hypothetical protein